MVNFDQLKIQNGSFQDYGFSAIPTDSCKSTENSLGSVWSFSILVTSIVSVTSVVSVTSDSSSCPRTIAPTIITAAIITPMTTILFTLSHYKVSIKRITKYFLLYRIS